MGRSVGFPDSFTQSSAPDLIVIQNLMVVVKNNCERMVEHGGDGRGRVTLLEMNAYKSSRMRPRGAMAYKASL